MITMLNDDTFDMDNRALRCRERNGHWGPGAVASALFALLVSLGGLASAEPPAEGERADDSLNTISKLRIEDDDKGTHLRLESAETPSFSVFKLRDPLRLVLDVSNSTLEAEEGSRRVDNGAISRVALSTHREEGRARVRLIVGFDQASHYDVRTEENDIVVFVEKRPSSTESPARAELEKTLNRKQQKLTDVQGKYDRASNQLDDVKTKLERARSEVEALKTRLDSSKVAASKREQLEQQLEERSERLDALQTRLDKRSSRVENLRSRLDQLEKERSRAQKRLKTLERKLADQRREADRKAEKVAKLKRAKQQRSEELEKSRAKYQSARSTLDQKRKQLERLRSELESLRKREREAAGDKQEKLQAKLQAKSRTLEELEAERTEAQKQVSELERQLQDQRRKSREKLETYRSKLEARDDKIASLEERLQTLKDRISQKEADSASRDQLEALRRKLKRQRKTLADMRKKAETSNDDSAPSAKAVPMKRGETNTIQDIRLETNKGESRIIVELERPGKYKRLPWKESRAVMMLNNVELPDRLQTKIEPDGQSGAVQFVSSRAESGDQVRMEAEVASGAREEISQKGNKLIWEFAPRAERTSGRADTRARTPSSASAADEAKETDSSARAARRTGGSDDESSPPRAPEQAAPVTSAPPRQSSPKTVTDPSKIDHVPGMARTEVTMDFRDADIQNVLRLFSKQGGVNIIAGDGVEGTITLRLRSVPLDQAFLIVLQSLELGFEMRGNVIRVATQGQLIEEQKARQKARQRQQRLRPLEVFLMPISYASASDMVDQVNRLLSPRGSVSVDERTNTLIIKDLPENIKSIRELVGALDTQVPQVLIEARIVETNDTFSQEFGIQWGGDFTMSQGNGNPTGLAFPNVLGIGGGATDGQTPTTGTSSNPNFAVNLPAPAGTGAGGALGLTMGSIGGNANLNLRLSAAEESGRAKIVSAPKVLTLDNREATISQGTSIPISVVSAAGVQTVFVDATLELTVTPHVTPDGNVQMEIQATKNEPDFQNTGARGDPTIIRKSAETELLVGDGETTVIGGIYTRNSGSSITGIPILHRIPILGSLFKQTGRNERRSELLIFITPRVVNRAEALGGVSAGDVVGQGSSLGPAQGGGGGNAEAAPTPQ